MALVRQLYIQVLIAIALAIALGLVAPQVAVQVKPLGDVFIALLRMLLGPIIFCSVVGSVNCPTLFGANKRLLRSRPLAAPSTRKSLYVSPLPRTCKDKHLRRLHSSC
jgi:hypothetical protein